MERKDPMSLRQVLAALPSAAFQGERVFFREIDSDDDLAWATCELPLPPEQQALVNPAGFSIGRAYLFPGDNVPYLICRTADGGEAPIGFILLRCWRHTDDPRSWCHFSQLPPRTNWSYFIVPAHQGKGYGEAAARLAMSLLLAAAPELPIALTTEEGNLPAQRLYTKLGFVHTGERDGDDPVFLFGP